MDEWGVDVCVLSRASIPVSPQEYRQELRTRERCLWTMISHSWDTFKP